VDDHCEEALDPSKASRLLRQFGVRPSRRLGQSFLVDSAALEKVIRAASLDRGDTVLEVGAGLGVLTRRLAREVRRVVSVEFDRQLIPILQQVVAGLPHVTLVHADIMHLDLEPLLAEARYRVVANIPYNLTSALLRRFLLSSRPPDRIVFMVQKEVGERVVSLPGEMSLLALSSQIYGSPSIRAQIPARAFYPQPKVDSVVLRVDVHPETKIDRELIGLVFALARAGFGQKRKTLRNSLASGLKLEPETIRLWLEEAGLPGTARPQELGLEAWSRLARIARSAGMRPAEKGQEEQG
jgi:16S rRNA (adenine1518-N6/adenine1519-N6)-dimethyltransferase